jgi:tetratricopeptide (TPR) repeat protein
MDAEQEITLADERIRALNRSGNYEAALRIAQALVARFPDHPRAHFVLGGAFDYQDREADAVLPYERAWELGLGGDDAPRFYVQYGSTLRNVGQFDEAVRVLQEGRARFPQNVAIQAFLALALFSAGRAAEALATALTIVTEDIETAKLQGYERARREYVAALRPSGKA